MNQLKHADQFRALLAHYHMSAAAQKVIADTPLVLLAAPTSSGRNTVIKELVAQGRYYYIISDTTREPRVDNGQLEQNGVIYWFRTEDEVLADLQNGEFLEAAVIHNQQVSGISVREINKAHQADKIAITDVTVVGAESIYRVKPDAKLVFMSPPSFEIWMERFYGRGELPADERRRRLESADHEFELALSSDHYTFVINDRFERAVNDINTIALGHDYNPGKQAAARRVVEKLHAETQRYLRDKG